MMYFNGRGIARPASGSVWEAWPDSPSVLVKDAWHLWRRYSEGGVAYLPSVSLKEAWPLAPSGPEKGFKQLHHIDSHCITLLHEEKVSESHQVCYLSNCCSRKKKKKEKISTVLCRRKREKRKIRSPGFGVVTAALSRTEHTPEGRRFRQIHTSLPRLSLLRLCSLCPKTSL